MNRRALIVFVILNIAISVGVAMLVIVWWQSNQASTPEEPVVQVFEVVVTATPGPTQTPWIVTVVGNNAPSVGVVSTPDPSEPTVAPTLNENILPDIATSAALTQVAVEASGSEERTYTVQSGDNPSIIAESFEVSLDDLLCANDLGTVDNPRFIFEGQVLLIPGADFVCDQTVVLETDDETDPDDDPDDETAVTDEDGDLAEAVDNALAETPIPTVTLAPTAENAQVIVAQVVGAEDVTSEGVDIRNQGGLVDLEGWTLYDTQGNVYTFPDYRLFPDAGVIVFTRVGEDTPAALFWGETQAIWEENDVVSLANADGIVQSTFRIEAP
jgi:LysM repeat protein